MSLEHNNILKVVKKAAVDAVLALKPMATHTGTVTSVDPLKISVDQKMILTSAQLVLTTAVRDYMINVRMGDTVEPTRCMVLNGLKVEEKVILLRCDGGQKFIVLDRMEGSE